MCKYRIVVEFFLTRFKKKHLNLNNIVGINAKVARRHIGYFLSFDISFCSSYLSTYSY